MNSSKKSRYQASQTSTAMQSPLEESLEKWDFTNNANHVSRVKDLRWAQNAYEFLLNFADAHERFVIYEVCDASRTAGFSQPETDRDWGDVHRRARRAGVISLDGFGVSKSKPDLIGARWRSNIFTSEN